MTFPLPADELLPHKGRMCCIDSLLYAEATTAHAMVTLTEGHILVHEGRLSPAGFIELAAQTAGAMQGFWQRQSSQPPKLGFLVGVQHFQIYGDARSGERLDIFIEILGELEGVSVLEAKILHGDHLLAEGRLKVFVQEEI